MSAWNYYNPVRVYAAAGCSNNLQKYLPSNTQKGLLVTTEGMLRRGQAEKFMQSLSCKCYPYTVSPNPNLDTLDSDISKLRQSCSYDFVVALGGGSAMDAAKAVACGLAQNAPEKPLHTWLREEKPLDVQALPLYCIPTTAGTGSEVTSFATIWDTATQQKFSLKNHNCYAQLALLDYELTMTLPWDETLIGALDALSHCLETMWNKTATPCSIAFAIGGLELICTHLPLVEKNLQNSISRKALQDGATLAGLAISQSHSSIAHAMSYPLTLHFNMPHGFACSVLLPAIIQYVTKKNAWNNMVNVDHYGRAFDLLAQYVMPEIFARYATIDEALLHIDEMFTPSRAATFVADITKEDVVLFFKKYLQITS